MKRDMQDGDEKLPDLGRSGGRVATWRWRQVALCGKKKIQEEENSYSNIKDCNFPLFSQHPNDEVD